MAGTTSPSGNSETAYTPTFRPLTSQFEKEEPLPRELWVKTNGVAWGFLISNLAFETTLTSRFTLSVPVYYSAMNYFRHTVKFRGFGIQPEVRYYPQNSHRLQPYLGVHMNFAYYNYATGGQFRYQDHDKRTPLWGGGVQVGARLPFRKHGEDTRWGVEAQIGVGMANMKTDKFINDYNGQRVDIYDETFIGVDNIAVSLYYTIHLKKRNSIK